MLGIEAFSSLISQTKSNESNRSWRTYNNYEKWSSFRTKVGVSNRI